MGAIIVFWLQDIIICCTKEIDFLKKKSYFLREWWEFANFAWIIVNDYNS